MKSASLPRSGRWFVWLLVVSGLFAPAAQAQLAPEIGFMHPAGGRSGESVEVTLGGYDWSPDMQIFVHDPRIKVELLGPPSAVLVPEPPYWFGAKARGPAWPLPREFRARLTIPADLPEGLVRWQVANANGVSPLGTLAISNLPTLRDDPRGKTVVIPHLPVCISGQIRRIEEVDQFEWTSDRDGPVTLELLARRLGSPLHGLLQVRDEAGQLLIDQSDSEGRDLTVTFAARQGRKYTIRLHDLDFAGDRSYVYQLQITPGPQLLAAWPAAGKPGETRSLEFAGIGIATGAAQLERVKRDVAFPPLKEGSTFRYSLDSPLGKSSAITLGISSLNELVKPQESRELALPELPLAVTGSLTTRFGSDTFALHAKKDERWRLAARSVGATPLDLELTILDATGKTLASQDDSSGSTDAVLPFTVPADGAYRVVVSDRSGKSGSIAASYRLAVERLVDDFSLSGPNLLAIPIGGSVKLPIKLVREGAFKGPVKVSLAGLPEGVSTATDLTIAADKAELQIELTAAANAPALASLVTVTATGELAGQMVTREAARLVVASTLKPRFKITPEGLDDVRKINRGASYWFPLQIERLEGFQGAINLEMTAKQQRHRQGLASDERLIPAGVTRFEYPIYVPEWMETTKTSRMILNGTAQVADPRGTMRTVVQRMELRLGLLPQGSLLKLAFMGEDLPVQPGTTVNVTLNLIRVPEFRDVLKLELVPDAEDPGLFQAEVVQLDPDQKQVTIPVKVAASVPGSVPGSAPMDRSGKGERILKFRAWTEREQGGQKGLFMSEAEVPVRFTSASQPSP
ncbi:MAG: hypothetical protein ACKOBW_02840 [Planctomycetota bacterium]